jgi:hypothetical protein
MLRLRVLWLERGRSSGKKPSSSSSRKLTLAIMYAVPGVFVFVARDCWRGYGRDRAGPGLGPRRAGTVLMTMKNLMRFKLFKRSIKEVAKGFGGEERLGRGAQGMVYRATYQGKPAVVKVLSTAAAMKEVNNTRMIKRLKAEAPPHVAPYLPEIFRADMLDHGGESIGVIIMELLSPVHDTTKKELFQKLYNRDPKQHRDLLEDSGFLSHVVHRVVNEEHVDLSENTKNRLTEAVVAAFGISVENLQDEDNYNLIKAMASMIKRKLGNDADMDPEALKEIIYRVFNEIGSARPIPEEHGSPALPGATGEGVRKALDWMVDNGIAWADLHEGNLLQRGNQLVLIDFGAYDATPEAGPELPKYSFDLFLTRH